MLFVVVGHLLTKDGNQRLKRHRICLLLIRLCNLFLQSGELNISIKPANPKTNCVSIISCLCSVHQAKLLADHTAVVEALEAEQSWEILSTQYFQPLTLIRIA